MTSGARWTIAIAVFVALGVSLLVGRDNLEVTRTSYGAVTGGFGAVHRLLVELDLSGGRSFAQGDGLEEAATIWWIEPSGLCTGVEAGSLDDAASGIWRSISWIERGGTAVVFLPRYALPCFRDIQIGGTPLPLRSKVKDDGAAAGPGDPEPQPRIEGEDAPQAIETVVHGPLHPRSRSLGAIPMRFFESSEGFDTLSSDEFGRPVVVSRALGSGRIVFAATAVPLTNAWLDHDDVSLFAVDLAVALGAPLFDEREHGLLPARHPIAYLVESAAFPALAGTALLAAIVLWWGRAPLPPRMDAGGAPSPSLEAFVASMAALYGETRDYQSVLRCYREFGLNQLRRLFLLPPDCSAGFVRARVLASRDLSASDFDVLTDITRIGSRRELMTEVGRIDSLVARVSR